MSTDAEVSKVSSGVSSGDGFSFALFSIFKRVLIVFVLFFFVIAFFSPQLIGFFRALLPQGIELISFSPAEVFSGVLTFVILLSLVLSFPFVLYEVVRFIKPALFERERVFLNKFLPACLGLFFFGAVFGVLVMAFFGLSFLADFAVSFGVKNYWSFSGVLQSFYLAFFGFGLAFQFPLVMYLLDRTGIVSAKKIASFRAQVIVFLLFVSAVLTPSPDAFSQLVLFFPVYFLFEGTLLYLNISNKRRRIGYDRHD